MNCLINVGFGFGVWYFYLKHVFSSDFLMENLGGKVLELSKFMNLFSSYSLSLTLHIPQGKPPGLIT